MAASGRALWQAQGRSRGEATRCGSESIEATLETWEGRLRLTLGRDGTYALEIGEKYGGLTPVYAGNLNEEVRL